MTRDAIGHGALWLWQPASGYRFNADARLLADFVLERADRSRPVRLCDLGAGVGVIGYLLLRGLQRARLTAVEIQPRLAELARRNAIDNDLGDRVEVLELDALAPGARRQLPGNAFDWVVCNPPYYAAGRGPVSPDDERAIARHDVRMPIPELPAVCRRLLRPGGRAAFVLPSLRLAELLGACLGAGLAPERLRLVHAAPSAPASRALLECKKGQLPGRLVVLPPLYERDADA